jgi:hypothetical protein
MSRIYASGVQATAIANIKADLAGFIVTGTDGIKRLDTQAMNAYLLAQFAQLSTTDGTPPSPATSDSVASAAQTVNTQTIVDTFNSQIRPEVFMQRSDWPQAADFSSGIGVASAVAQLQAELQQASQAINDYYGWLADSSSPALEGAVQRFMGEKNVDSSVPPGVVRLIETRSVIYTYVTDRDEESAPSPPADLVELDQNDTATYTGAAAPTGRNVNRLRWYRSNSSNKDSTFQFVDEVPITSGYTYLDSKKAEELAEPCPTIMWTEPRANLVSLAGGPNGTMAGGFGNSFAQCVPYTPYAWPREYEISLEYPFVGCIACDAGWFVATQAKPYLVTGPDPAISVGRKIETQHAVVSRRGMVVWNGGVLFPSADGYCSFDGVRVRNITGQEGFDLFTRDQWQALQPSTIFASINEDSLFFWTNGGAACYALNLVDGKLVTVDRTASAVFRNDLNDLMYVTDGVAIQEMFTAATKRSARWKGKLAVSETYVNLGWAQAESDFESAVTVNLYREGTLTDTVSLASNSAQRLSSGRVKEHEVEVIASVGVQQVVVADSAEGLRQV